MANFRDFKKAVKDVLLEHRLYCSLAAGLKESGEYEKAYELASQTYRATLTEVETLLVNIKAGSKEVENKRAHFRGIYEQILKICRENEAKLAEQLGIK